MSIVVPLLPETAPFSATQRFWIDGWLAGRLAASAFAPATAPSQTAEEFPWHDPTLPLDTRLALAAGRPKERVLMAAMAQLDCGQCGYLCRSYAEAIASGAESGLARCVPGGKETVRMLKVLAEEINTSPVLPAVARTSAEASAPVANAPIAGYSRDHPVEA